jgi:hypothetical protein
VVVLVAAAAVAVTLAVETWVFFVVGGGVGSSIVCLFVFLALQPIVVVFSQPRSGL